MAAAALQVKEIIHPDHMLNTTNWMLWRKIYDGGSAFISKYLFKYSIREDEVDFANRKEITFNPGHSRTAVLDIRNAIFEQMGQIVRNGGEKSYQDAVSGLDGGVDQLGNSMTSYIGRYLLPEMLFMGKVGVYIDKPVIEDQLLRSETADMRPYMYHYAAEDIMSWSFDNRNRIITLLLRDYVYPRDPVSGLITSAKTIEFRLLRRMPDGVHVSFYKEDASIKEPYSAITLNLPEIPFVIMQIEDSLLLDIGKHQIALLNMMSAATMYGVRSNFPMYTEQRDLSMDVALMRAREATAQSNASTGEADDAADAGDPTEKIGASQGRAYGKGLERPGFIHPSPDPLLATLKFKSDLEQEIRRLVSLAVTNLATQTGLDAKMFDDKGMEAGLSVIGNRLQFGEIEIARVWHSYSHATYKGEVHYPDRYQLQSDDELRKEAKDKIALANDVPSRTFRTETLKNVATVILGAKISSETHRKMLDEIDKAPAIVDATTLLADLESALVTTITASTIRGYPDGEAEAAKTEHAERLARIQASQTKSSDLINPSDRGLPDADPNPGSKEDRPGKQPDE